MFECCLGKDRVHLRLNFCMLKDVRKQYRKERVGGREGGGGGERERERERFWRQV